MKTGFLAYVDDDFIVRLEKFLKKYVPYFLVFAAAFFLGVIVNTFEHMR